MKIIESGVLPNSKFYINTVSAKAQEMFYYLNSIGHYYCTTEYLVVREHFDNFLLMIPKSGSGILKTPQGTFPFHKDQIVLVDCYEKHQYSCSSDMEIYWLHFDGQSSRKYVEEIFSKVGPVIDVKNPYVFESMIHRIYDAFESENGMAEAQIAQGIFTLLTEIYVEAVYNIHHAEKQTLIDDILSYISKNLSQDLTVDDLSKRASLSKYYFTRLFKAETGFTPYEYILSARINASKFYLRSAPHLRVKEICFFCGFSSESNFCNTFKRLEGITPSEYRGEL